MRLVNAKKRTDFVALDTPKRRTFLFVPDLHHLRHSSSCATLKEADRVHVDHGRRISARAH